METLRQDIFYGFRVLLKHSGVTAMAVVALALGIGANSAMFSVVNAALIQPLPFSDPDRLIIVNETVRRESVETRPASYPDFIDFRDQNQTFEALAAFDSQSFNLTGNNEPERISGEIVSASYFPILGTQAKIGRTFSPEEDHTPDQHPVTVISHKLWQRNFGGDSDIVGKTMKLNEKDYTIVGVMPEGFEGLSRGTEIWVPMMMISALRPPTVLQTRGNRWHQVLGRLKPGASIEQAQSDLETVAGRLAEQYPNSNKDRGVQLVGLHEATVGDLRPTLVVLLAAVGFVLLIACANVANLLLARSTVRQKEIAIRTALGASRLRLLRQLLTESVLLALIGGAAGLLLAIWGVDLLVALIGDQLPSLINIQINARVLGFTLLVSLLTGVLFGLVPALQASKPELNEFLKEGGRHSTGGAGHRARRILIVSEVALALMLLIGAGLMLKSFQRLQAFDPGFKPDQVMTLRVALPRSYTPPQITAFNQQLVDRITALPPAQSAAMASDVPLDGNSSATYVAIEGLAAPDNQIRGYVHNISPNYFSTLGIPLIRGRDFSAQDTDKAPGVVIISDSMARRLWPDQDPLGKRVSVDEDKEGKPIWIQVVGVVGDVRYRTLIRDQNKDPDLYFPFLQNPIRGMVLAVRSNDDPANLVSALRSEVRSLDPNLPLFDIAPMQQRLKDQMAQARFGSLLLGLFAVIAMVLAAVGIYGVISYWVTQQTRDIGIRMALGAARRDILKMIVGEGMTLVGIGLGVGLAGSLISMRWLASQLYNVSATDPITFAGVSFILATVALAASYIPARRATRVDPMVALRYE